MTIAALQKVTLAASNRDRQRVLQALQNYGGCHLIGPDGDGGQVAGPSSRKDNRASEALRYLSDSKLQRRVLAGQSDFDRAKIVAQVLAVKARLRQLEAALEQTRQRIAVVRPWGNFTYPPKQSLQGRRFWFYILPVAKRHALNTLDCPWQIVGRSNTRLFVVVIHHREPAADLLPVERQHLGSLSLSELLAQQEQLELEIDDAVNERYSLTRYRRLIAQSLIEADNQAFLQYAEDLCQLHHGFFTLQVWLPQKQLAQLQSLATAHDFAFVTQAPGEQELPPTLLQPNKLFKSGALLAKIYQMPGYRARDPSAHLYIFFALFFAMILSDAGYAAVLGGLLGLFWQRLGGLPLGAELRWLGAVVITAAVVWGALVGSYFGVEPQTGWLAWLHVFDLQNYQAMMVVSVAVGVLHLCLANFASLGHAADVKRARVVKVGWNGVILGGFLWWLLSAQPVWLWLPQLLFASGLSAVFAGSGWRKIHGLKSLLAAVASGVLALINITKLFGDLLSYMRLFALGLASASLAITFNQLAAANIERGGVALIGGLLILLLGHGVNLLLAIMGGVVHGLRLNFIEFYNWSEPGEGYPFVPFARKEIPYD